MLFVSVGVHAETCGPGTEVAWDYEQPLPSNVLGFRLYANDVEVWNGITLTAQPDLGSAAETKSFYVRAYNSNRESLNSNAVDCDFEPGGPPIQLGIPTNARFPN